MSNGTTHFDAEIVQEFIEFLERQVTIIEHCIDNNFKNDGPLTRMPAFGSGAGLQLAGKYQIFHGGIWRALHTVRADYLGFIEALQGVIEANEAAEAATVAEFGEFA